VRLLIISALIVVVWGCASSRHAQPSEIQGVTFETYTGPFCGRCDTTKITVANDGRVWIEQGYWAGDYRNLRTTRQQAQVSPEALNRFRARLDAYRPQGELILADQPPCAEFTTDTSGVHVTWRDEQGEDRLDYNFGCDGEARQAMAEALQTAPALLAIPGLRIRELEW
jgi:hypothetical protein